MAAPAAGVSWASAARASVIVARMSAAVSCSAVMAGAGGPLTARQRPPEPPGARSSLPSGPLPSRRPRAARSVVQAAAIDVEEDGRAYRRPIGLDDDLDVRDRADPHPVERDGRSDVEALQRAVEVGDVRLPWSEEESVAAQHEHARDREEHGPDDERADDRRIRFATHGPRPS